jgi:hypothetical protein
MPRNAACQLSKFPDRRLGVLWSGRSGLVHHARRVVAEVDPMPNAGDRFKLPRLRPDAPSCLPEEP